MMMWGWMLWVGCGGAAGDGSTKPGGDTGTKLGVETPEDSGAQDTESRVTIDTSVADTGDPDTSGADTGLVDTAGDSCGPDAALEVLSLQIGPGPAGRVGERLVELELSTDAEAALVCVSDVDPSEAHLIESSVARSHSFRLQGLLADTSYTCAATPTCPVVATDPVPFAIDVGPLPSGVPELSVQVFQGSTPHGYLLAPYQGRGGCGMDRDIYLFDLDGHLRWWTEVDAGLLDFEVLPSGQDELLWGGGETRTEPQRIHLWDGVVWQADLPRQENFHHDAKFLEDGRLGTLEDRRNTSGGDDWDGFGIRVSDPATNLVEWEYNSQTAYLAGELGQPAGWDNDPYHANWFDMRTTAEGETMFVSLCYDWKILAIDMASQAVRWTIGQGGDMSVVDATGSPLGDAGNPHCQHGLEVNADGTRMLVYDNGQQQGRSRAMEYEIDATAHTATLLWEWSEPGWYDSTLGDVDWLDDGMVLVTEAHADCWEFESDIRRSKAVAIDPATGVKQWEAVFGDRNDAVYRSEVVDGCQLLASTRHCPTLAARLDTLRTRINLP